MAYAAETPRLYLETLSLKHLEDFHEQWNNDEGVLWSSKPKKNSLEESRDWLANYILPTEENWDIEKYALLLKDERNERGELKMIGMVGTNRWCAQGMEVGYCLSIKYWGKGYITEGFRAFLELYWTLPERKNINRLVAKTHPENVASQKVCVKSGGTKGEVLKEEYERYVDKGVKSDVWLFYFDRPGVVVEQGSDGRVDVKS
ncbi:acyl-CoA N-acyltransferase [Stipitochalara longipes BDJ]|nr:acyl-CoA N-acyltransferase [Stipitochalara longipes BDJ]